MVRLKLYILEIDVYNVSSKLSKNIVKIFENRSLDLVYISIQLSC